MNRTVTRYAIVLISIFFAGLFFKISEINCSPYIEGLCQDAGIGDIFAFFAALVIILFFSFVFWR